MNIISIDQKLIFSVELCLIHTFNTGKLLNIVKRLISRTNLRNCHLFAGCHGYHVLICDTSKKIIKDKATLFFL